MIVNRIYQSNVEDRRTSELTPIVFRAWHMRDQQPVKNELVH